MIEAVDAEIERLQAIRAQLERSAGSGARRAKPRKLSDEGRRRIAEAQNRRWARVKASAPVQTPGTA